MAAIVRSRGSYTSNPVIGGCGPVPTHHADEWLAASVLNGHGRYSMSGYLTKNDIGGGVVVFPYCGSYTSLLLLNQPHQEERILRSLCGVRLLGFFAERDHW